MICRLNPEAEVPAWAGSGDLVSVTRTADELSIVCAEAAVPEGVRVDRGWRSFKVKGPLDLSLIGVLASLSGPLAQAKVNIFAVSTYDTDYLLVKQAQLARASEALIQAGHCLTGI